MEILETDLESVIKDNPQIIGSDLTFDGRQVPIEGGRLDLVYKDGNGGYVLVELKLGCVGTDALNQLKRYINFYRSKTPQKVKGIIICKDIMPAFEEKYRKLKNIKVLRYGWKLAITSYEFEK